jgi:hypothetical protein
MQTEYPKDYQFNMMIIKPNTCQPGSCYAFEEDYYKLINHNPNNGPINNIDDLHNKLITYLKNKDYFETKTFNFNTLLMEIESYINPSKSENHRYEVKTCLNNENELIMFVYDELMPKNISQFNHLATILGPNYESVFGPVFITKMIKNEKGLPYKHENITYNDLVKLWIGLKQVNCWNYKNGEWNIKTIFNNNKSFNPKKYKYINIKSSLVFYELKKEKEILDIKKYLVDNINDIPKINEYFEEVYICRLKTGEYVNEELNYNTDIHCVQEHIINTAINGFDDFNKYQVVMESIFQNVDQENVIF